MSVKKIKETLDIEKNTLEDMMKHTDEIGLREYCLGKISGLNLAESLYLSEINIQNKNDA